MGGKKKTKWKKLPLEEFTKDCSKLQGRRRSEENKSNVNKTEENVPHNPVHEDVEDNSLQFSTEYSENQDGVWYPTHYLVYNPVEIPMYPNYLIPSDTNCYYYPPNEINPVQDYASAPYQEYIPPVKDTVYLLFPASALRPPQASPYDWRNRRKRRRYGGYAEYAVIPDKTNIDEKNRGKKETNSTAEKSNNQSCEFKTSSVNTEHNGSHEVLQNFNQEPDIVKVHIKSDDNCKLQNNMGLSNGERKEVPSNRPKKNVDVCGVHSKCPEQQEPGSSLKTKDLTQNERLSRLTATEGTTETRNTSQDDSTIASEQTFGNIQSCDSSESAKNSLCEEIDQNRTESERNSSFEQKTGNSGVIHNIQNIRSVRELSPEITLSTSSDENEMADVANNEYGLFLNSEIVSLTDTKNKNIESDQNNFPQTSLPDILNVVNKTSVPHSTKISDNTNISRDKIRDFSPLHKANYINESVSKSTPVSSQSAYIPYQLNSDASSNENEIIYRQPPLKSQSAQANSSIYKLAYDESLTDQSDSESRSPSPIDPESQMPSSLINHEINVYEADSGDDAGSEDLELIPHRYESESFLNKNKHVYENKLSLAVELLRTRESLPYDAQFKRVTEDPSKEPIKSEADSTGAVNLGFLDDSNFLDSFEMESKHFESDKADHTVITNQCQTRKYPGQNAASFEISLDDSLTSSCEIADEVVAQAEDHQGNTEEVNNGYRRLGVQFRHYFSPRSALVNPWNCCIVM